MLVLMKISYNSNKGKSGGHDLCRNKNDFLNTAIDFNRVPIFLFHFQRMLHSTVLSTPRETGVQSSQRVTKSVGRSVRKSGKRRSKCAIEVSNKD